MALPVTISGVSFPSTGSGNLGPFIDGSDNVYIVTDDGSGLAVHKATDPTSSFTEQDSASAPAIVPIYMDAYQDGTTIHIMCVNSSYVTHYARFSMSTDTWQTVPLVGGGTGGSATVFTPSPAPTTAWGGITVRSDGDVIIVHPGNNPSTMGGNYQQVAYSRLEGTTWTTGVVVASTGAKNDNYLYAYPVMGSSDQCHFGYTRDTDGNFYLRALSSANALRTQRSTTTTTPNLQNGINYTRSSTEKIAFSYLQGNQIREIEFTHFTDDTNPSFIARVAAGYTITAPTFHAGYRADDNATNTDKYVGFIKSADGDVYLVSDSGGTTWSDENSGSAIRTGTVAGISGNIYSRGGNRLYAFVYDDAGTVKYDEYTLYSEGTFIVPSAIASAATVYNPTLIITQTVLPNTIASGETVHNPTLQAGSVTIAPNAIASGETFYEPTLVQGAATVIPNHIASEEIVYNPTLFAGAATIVPDAIASAETVYDPTLIAGAATIVPNAIASTETVYNVTLSPGAATIVPNAIASGETVHQPTVTQSGGTQNVLPDTIASGETVYNVTLTATFTMLPDTIASAETVHNPTLAAIATILPDAIASGATVHNPTLIADQFVLPDTIASTETVHEPILSTGGSFIVPDAIASVETVHEPTLVPLSVTMLVDTIASSEIVYNPTLSIAGETTYDDFAAAILSAGKRSAKRRKKQLEEQAAREAQKLPDIRWGIKKDKKQPAQVREVASAVMQVARQVEQIPEIAEQIILPPEIDYTEIASRILENERLDKLRNMAFREFARRVEAALEELDDEEVLLMALA